jgi:hypothetical protein
MSEHSLIHPCFRTTQKKESYGRSLVKNNAFLQTIRERMFTMRVSHEKAAEYLHITQPTFSRKLAGKHAFTYDEAEELKVLLGMVPAAPDDHVAAINPRSEMVKAVVEALPEDDQKKMCAVIIWALEEKEDRVKPAGQEALRALRALG